METWSPTPVWLRRYTKFTAVSTLFLIFAGAMVTSTGSGLAVPDWPLSYGMVFPPMVGGIFYEHGHRMIAATVGFLTVIQACWLQWREPKRFLRRLGWAAVAAVIVQGLLGGLTVLFLLPPAVSIAHAGLAELFLCINVAIAFLASDFAVRTRNSKPAETGTRAATTMLVAAVFMQILLGALMRHLGAGLAIPDFPLSFGHLIPEMTSTGIAVNYSHRVGALAVAVLSVYLAWRLFASRTAAFLRPIGVLLLCVVALQIAMGAFTVWSGKNPLITSLHVVTGALTLAISLTLALSARLPVSDPSSALSVTGDEVIA